MKKRYQLMWGLLITILISSCNIKEDYDDCDNVSISFEYWADGDHNVLSQYISKIDLYVFDAGGQLVNVYPYSQSEITGEIAFRLPAGTYEVAAIGNAYSRTTVTSTDETDLDNIFITHPAWGTNDPITGNDHNYLGTKIIEVPSGEGQKVHEVVRLYSAHIDVEIEVHEIEPLANGECPLQLVIEQANAATSFRNRIDETQQGTYQPTLEYDETNHCFQTDDLVIFRIDRNGTIDSALCQHVIRLVDSEGNTLAEVNLADFLARYTDRIDLTLQEALLPIAITFNPHAVTVQIPTWYIEDVTPGWD